MLAVDGLTKRFGGFLAVDQVSFEAREGEILGLIGPNGSGKSTTFNLIAGNLRPTQGSIRFAGAEIAGLAAHTICRQGIARTFQIPRPFRKLSLRENVALAAYYGEAGGIARAEAQHRAEEALGLVGLPTDATATTDGLGAAALKKLELARALATKPRLLLADESLGGLDSTEMEHAADLLESIRSRMGVTIIWVEHIMGVLMRIVDRVIVLDHGEKIFEGAPAQAAVDPRVTEVYLGKGRDLMLSLAAVSAGYGSFRALFDVSLEVPQGEAVGVIGPNGAGKTTLMRVISGLVPLRGGAMTLEGRSVGGLPAHRMVEQGIAHVPENRRLFPRLTVEDNLRIGAFIPQARAALWRAARAGLRTVSPPQGPARPAGRHALRRRAADVRDRPRADVAAETAVDGRAVRRSGAAGRAAGVRSRPSHPRRRADRAHRRAERAAGARRGRPRLSAGGRQHQAAGTSAELKGNDFIRKSYMGL